MKVRRFLLASALTTAICLAAVTDLLAQTAVSSSATPMAASAPTTVPALVPYSGIALSSDSRPLAAETAITFLIYKEEQGGEPLFSETQTVAPDPSGRYTVQLGATLSSGIPLDLFSSGEARWLEVQIAGQAHQPRVLLASVPYALKAADATTLGGLPASAFVLAATRSGANAAISAVTPDSVSNVTTTGGTAGYLPEFSGASTVVDSPVFISGADVGIGKTTPATTLDVNGTVTSTGLGVNGNSTFNGIALFPAQGTATASTAFHSQYFKMSTSAFNSSTHAVVDPRFQLQAEPLGNNTASPSATFNLLSSTTSASPTETGFFFNANGTIHFAPGQTFPGADITGTVNAAGYEIGGTSFGTGSTSGGTAYLGFAGNASSTGTDDIGVGYQALSTNTSGSDNTALGYKALSANTTGSLNTGIGYLAGPDAASHALTNSTALGANATVSQSNSLVLGKTKAGSPGASFVSVGIGTAKPATVLEASVDVSSGLGPTLTLTNPGGAGGSPTNQGTAESIDFNSYLPASEPEGSLPEARIEAVDDGVYSDNLIFFSKFVSGEFSFLQQNLTIQANGQTAVGLPTSGTLPALTALLTVFNTGPTGWDGIDTFGGAEVGSGISATGGDETASSSIQGGTGGSFTGGFSPGTTGDGIFATPGDATFSTGVGWAGLFVGDIDVTGAIFAGVKDFKIDHPLDPANKYLVHSSVESSEMMNIYSGNVTTDELGLATVKLPDWFEAENTDFRYQLTVIGGRFAQAIVSKEIADHQFTISTNASNVKVSWQVTAVRQDAYAKAHPLVVEQGKPANERGYYIHPELFGQPADEQTEWGRHPEQMQRMKEVRERQRLQDQPRSTPNATPVRHDQPASAVNRSFSQPAAPIVPQQAPEAQVKPISQVETK